MSVQIVKLLDPMSIVNIPGGLVPKGAYNNSTAYSVGDSVSYNGSSYVCITASTGNLPTDTAYWQLVASKGNTGATGLTGATGATGAPGVIQTVNGKTGTSITLDKTDVGLGNVDNTSDADKPVSTAQQTALNAKANASDTVNLTGNQTVAGVKTFSSSPVVPTATTSTQAVNKAQMDAADALKVNKAGDTMTGGLIVDRTSTLPGTRVYVGASSADRPLTIEGNHASQLRPFVDNKNTAGDSQFSFASNGSTRWSAGYNADTGFFAIADGYDLNDSRRLEVTTWGFRSQGIHTVYGTGFPEGIISAPVGSIYIDTAITNGASSWIKKSGTGNTGWQVLEGDTGWRDISSLLVNGWTATAVQIKRSTTGGVIFRASGVNGVSATSTLFLAGIPVGMRPTVVPETFTTIEELGNVPYFGLVGNDGSIYTNQTRSTAKSLYMKTMYESPQAWPTTLPGVSA